MITIPAARPQIGDAERAAVDRVLESGMLAQGPEVASFEQEFSAQVVDGRHAVAVNSGTSALHLCVKAAGIADGDEVITTPFSFVASANCMLYERAIPRFVDIDINTYNIDTALIPAAVNSKTRGILPVHVFGHPSDMPAINQIAARRGLSVIEDACEAIGATIGGRKAGSFGDSGAFAFYPNKQITTGEGGAVVTNDENVARLSRSWRNQGRGDGGAWLQHQRLGYNYRLADINCALGLGQLTRLQGILRLRKNVAETYNHVLSGVPGVILPPQPSGAVEMSWFVYVIRLADEFSREDRDRVLQLLRQEGVACNNYFAPIHLQDFYRQQFGYRRGDFPVTEHVADRTIALPFFNHLREQQVYEVAGALSRALNELSRQSRNVPLLAK